MVELLSATRNNNILQLKFNTGHVYRQDLAIVPEQVDYENKYDPVFWESLCHGCAECCYYRWQSEAGQLQSSGVPCRHLDVETRRCREYGRRETIIEGCQKMSPGNMPTGMPSSCGYVKYYAGGSPL